MLLNLRHYPLHIERLGDIWKTADHSSTLLQFFLSHRRRQENDWYILQLPMAADSRRDISAVSVGHHHIEQNQIRLELLSSRHSARALVLFANDIFVRPLQIEF